MTSRHWVLLGWVMFTVSGFFFLADAIESGDRTALGSAATWLVGVGFFLRSMTIEDRSDREG